MGFKADYRVIDGYRQLVRRAWDDTQEAQGYANKYCDVPRADQGWLQLLGDANEAVSNSVQDLLGRIHSVVNSAHGELSGVVEHYKLTDTGAAARVDQTYPKVDRITEGKLDNGGR
ncbi:hypothetical protein N8J89_38970 [Crossiella sp. CA-258035]|uniref:hypothetical protein n=1 Tax=Crossiella sp. CA-258035 TaxID=2981138 RepID=UPI0024BCAAF0|nr:hypothetical protein [Crossiella sp. CA-258035]WHT19014.1 hypothetical protein N8J89_38970 [Crossiella sp. CA-258035]